MINIGIIGAVNLPNSTSSSSSRVGTSPGSRCILKLSGRELFRTELANPADSPTWNAKYSLPVALLTTRSKENFRPFFFEYLDIEILDYSRNVNYGEKIGEARIPLENLGKVQAYKVLRVLSGGQNDDSSILETSSEGKVIIDLSDLNISNDDTTKLFSEGKRLQLFQVLSIHLPQFQHLYINFDDWTYGPMIGATVLPGPRLGEVVLDKHEAEWGVTVNVNAFGDRCSVICRGTLYLTDLRVLFIPFEIIGPSWMDGVLTSNHKINADLNAEQITAIRRLTVQLPLSSIQDVRYHAESLNSTIIIFETKDSTSIEFKIRRIMNSLSVATSTSTSTSFRPSHHSNGPLGPSSSSSSRPNSATSDYSMILEKTRMKSPLYRCGLDTEDIIPQMWCSRVVDEINWRLREDLIWYTWMKYLKETCDRYYPSSEMTWLKSTRLVMDYELEYQRLRMQDSNWVLSDINANYKICNTYPKSVVVPGLLTEKEIFEGAVERSRGRIAALVWMHPSNKAPLCRAAQPMAGMSGTSNEADRKFCIAIRASCPTGLTLRIADARPRLNANANAIQGKGFENIAFLGGPKVASLVFLDIENIHVMRSSYAKLKEGLMPPSLTASSSNFNGNESSSDVVFASRWLFHIASILRGSVGIAESLMLGHPILLHCSDGWDRTAQLTGVSQLLLDPYYRTIHGFFALVNKEFCAYGHRFESRLNKSSNKESSPVFLQFLDATYQITLQHPGKFEFTSYFLLVLCQTAYSGYFSTFRGNCEQERNFFLRRNATMEDISPNDLQYSTVFCYIGILLRCPGTARLMVNQYYQPTSFSSTSTSSSSSSLSAEIDYLRIRSNVTDIFLWREGIFGYFPDIAGFYGNYEPSEREYHMMQTHGYSRLTTYLRTQSPYLNSALTDRVDIILGHDNFLETSWIIPYQQAWDPTSLSFRKQHSKMAIMQNIGQNMSRKEISACARILIWYRTEKALLPVYEETIKSSRLYKPQTKLLLKRIFRGLLQAEWRLKLKLRLISDKYTGKWIHGLVEEILEDIMNRCLRGDNVIVPYDTMESNFSSMVANPTASNMIDPLGAAKTLSQKIRNLGTSSTVASVSSLNRNPIHNGGGGVDGNDSPLALSSSSPIPSHKRSISSNGIDKNGNTILDRTNSNEKTTFTGKMMSMIGNVKLP